MTLVISTPSRSRPIAASMRSRSWPARPTKGRPIRSSSAPGASPMIMTGAAGLPSAMTVLVAVRFSAQPSNPAIAASSAASVSARAAKSRADCAASPSESAKAAGGDAATARTDCGGAASGAAGRTAETRGGAAARAGSPVRRRSPRPPPSRHTSATAPALSRGRRVSTCRSSPQTSTGSAGRSAVLTARLDLGPPIA